MPARVAGIRFASVPLAPVLLAGALAIAAPAAADTVVFPHLLEVSGRITNTQNTFDTQFFMTYSSGLAGTSGGPGASVDLYLFDQSTGQPMRSALGGDVCNPCTFALGDGTPGAAPRKRTVVVDDLIEAAGGFPRNTVLGWPSPWSRATRTEST